MKILRLLAVALLSTLCLSGCLQIEKTVKVKPDGSGTVEETVVLSKEAVAQMKQMASGFGGPDAKAEKKGFDLMDEAKLKEQAAKMGEGVTFVSAKKIDNAKSEGFTATYAFTDINKLKVDQNPSSAMPAAGGPSVTTTSKIEPMIFKFTKGSPATLAITMPQPEAKAAEKKPEMEGMEDMAMQMMKQMFKDMRVTIAVEAVGTIKETNAEYRDGSRVTLMEMDFNKLLENPEKLKAMAKENPKTIQDSKKLMKGVEGVKIEAAPVVTIKFQ